MIDIEVFAKSVWLLSIKCGQSDAWEGTVWPRQSGDHLSATGKTLNELVEKLHRKMMAIENL